MPSNAQAVIDGFFARNRAQFGDLRMEDAKTDSPPEDKPQDGDKADLPKETAEEKAARLERERDDWKAQARKHEDRAKANKTAADDLAKLKQAGLTDQEKAVEQAKAEARADVLREVGKDRARDRFLALAAGKVADPQGLLDDVLDAARWVAEDGSLDEAALVKAVERMASTNPAKQDPKFTPVDHGSRGGSRPTQLGEADLKRMSPAEIDQARRDGRLNDYLGIKA